jgi:dTDP-D-glucose 4,6-dehydratase
MREKLGFAAQTQLDEGLEQTVEWTRTNMDLIERAMAKHVARMPSGALASRD